MAVNSVRHKFDNMVQQKVNLLVKADNREKQIGRKGPPQNK